MTEEQVRGALALTRSHPQATLAGRFFYELFLAQDKPWALIRGVSAARKLAKRRKLHDGVLALECGDLVEWSRRGARSAHEGVVLLAFAMVGASEALGEAPDGALTDFAERLLQLQLATGVDIQPLVEELLNETQRRALYEGLAFSIVTAARHDAGTAVPLARQAAHMARVLWLFSAGDPAAAAAREQVDAAVADPRLWGLWSKRVDAGTEREPVAPMAGPRDGEVAPASADPPANDEHAQAPSPACAMDAAQDAAVLLPALEVSDAEPVLPAAAEALEVEAEAVVPAAPEAVEVAPVAPSHPPPAVAIAPLPTPDQVVTGELLPGAPPGRWATYGRLVSGWALLRGIARAVGWALGLRHHGRFVLRGERLLVATETRIFGVTTQQSRSLFARSQWEGARVTVRQPLAGHLLGLSALSLATYAGGLLLIDGALLGHYALLVAGGLLIGGGALFEGLLFLGSSRVRLRGVVELQVAGQRWFLRRVPAAQAQRWFAALQGQPPALGGSERDSTPSGGERRGADRRPSL